MKILVTGANGFIGSHLCKYLLDQGVDLSIMIRRSSDLYLLRILADKNFDKINVLYGDVTDQRSLNEIFKEYVFDVVYNLFGAIKGVRLSDFERINVDGVINVCNALIDSERRPDRVIFLSSIAAAGPGKAKIEREEHDPTNVLQGDFYGVSKWKMEEAAKEYYSQINISVVRCPAVYGAGDSVSLGLYKLAKAGLLMLIGVRPQYQSVLDVRDLCTGLMKIPEYKEANHEVFYFTADDELSWAQIQKSIGRNVFDRKFLLPVVLPKILVLLIGYVNSIVGIISGQSYFLNKSKAIEAVRKYWIFSNRKAKSLLSWVPRYTFSQTVSDAGRWYKDHKWL